MVSLEVPLVFLRFLLVEVLVDCRLLAELEEVRRCGGYGAPLLLILTRWVASESVTGGMISVCSDARLGLDV